MKTGCRRSLLGTVLSTAQSGKGMAFSAMGDVAEVYSEIKHNQTCFKPLLWLHVENRLQVQLLWEEEGR